MDGAQIDDEHRIILKRIEALLPALRAADNSQGTFTMLDALELYVSEHFAHEERHMAKVGYPFTIDHVADHARLTEQLLTLRTNLERAEPDGVLLRGASTTLAMGVASHVDTFDRSLAEYLRETR